MARETQEHKAARLFDYIRRYMTKHRKAPTHREMAEGISVSTATIPVLLDILERGGIVRYQPDRWRGLRLNERWRPDAS